MTQAKETGRSDDELTIDGVEDPEEAEAVVTLEVGVMLGDPPL